LTLCCRRLQTQMQHIKVGIVSTSYPLTENSVSGLFISRFVEHLPHSVEPTVITPAPSTSLPLSDSSARIHIVTYRYAPLVWQKLAHEPGGVPAMLGNKPWLHLLLPFFLVGMFLTCLRYSWRLDLFHANWSATGVVTGLAAWLTSKPVVTTLRGSDVNMCRKSWTHRVALHLCLRLSRRVVAVSQSLRDEVREMFPSVTHSRISVILNGTDSQLATISRVAAMDSVSRPVRLITIGNLTHNKSTANILRALAEIRDMEFEFYVVGNGPERGALEQLARDVGLRERTVFTGQVAPHRIPELLAKADLFVHASQSEGRPNVVIEAMTAALPVAASDISGIRGLVQHDVSGLLFPPNDIRSLSSQLRTLIQNPALRRQMGDAGRAWVLDQLPTWDETARQYARLYEEVINESRHIPNN
jgi:glycosyltransferase involved in cell wall biosynthesis